ncbi:MAG: flagellar filament capping protein FliD [Telluria sp.]
MGVSTPGIGSGLDVEGIITKLMNVESQPLADFDKKTQTAQTKISAFGKLSSALGTFQGALSTLTTRSSFQTTSTVSSNTDVLVGSASGDVAAGVYKIKVSQTAQAQTLVSTGQASASTAIGAGVSNRITFQLGSVSGGSFGVAGSVLAPSVAAGGISNGSLSINGTTIATDASTKNAKLLADAINAKSDATGVTASAATSTSATLFGAAGSTTFGDVDTSGGGTYSLTVAGIEIASQATGLAAGAGATAASIDATLAGSNATTAALTAAGITFTGTAAAGTLQFKSASGYDLTVAESVTGAVNGGIGTSSASANAGSSVTATGALTLTSKGDPITIGGSNPAAAGLTAGQAGAYLGASYTQSSDSSSGSILIDSSNNSLQGIRDAINKANFGVTATIVSDGSATPYHLVLTSSKTGEKSAFKISVDDANGGTADAALTSLLAYDPSGVQNLTQTSAAQDTKLTVNGIAVQSSNKTVTDAIEGVTLTIGAAGSADLHINQDSTSVKNNIGSFVKAYNDLTKAITDLTKYDSDTKTAAPLLGDSTVQSLQASLRRQMSASLTGLSGNLTTLSQIGVSFQKDGSLTSDSSKLDKAISSNLNDIVGLFAAIGKTSDKLVTFQDSTAKTQPGTYALNITQLATKGTLTSAAPLASSITIAADTEWTVKLDDTNPPSSDNSATVLIPAGTYTASGFTTALQSAINGASAFSGNGKSVTATLDTSGNLVLSSAKYGSVSNISLSSITGTAVSDIFGGAASVDGVDVKGTIGGYNVTGSGQYLTGAAGSPAEGLKLLIDGGSLGARGDISFSQGYAYQLNKLADGFLGSDGMITGKTNGLNATVKDIAKQKDAFALRLTDIEARYRAQYTALDTAISKLNSTQQFLTQQLASLSKSTSS